MYRYAYDPDFKVTKGIGSFEDNHDTDYKNTVKSCFESFRDQFQMDPRQSMGAIVSSQTLFNNYKDQLFGDVLNPEMESSYSHYGNSDITDYTEAHAAKLDQFIENSRLQMVDEASNVGQLSPIVAATMPILKKEYILNQFKDMVHVIVTDTPIIKYAYERRFLKDANGTKKYFPECFYDSSYAEFTDQTIGKRVTSKWYPETGAQPITQLNVLEESNGSLSRRDALGYDFSIDGVQITVPSDVAAGTETVTVEHLDIRPDFATRTFSHKVEIPSKKSTVEAPTIIFIYGTVDFYTGIVNVSISTDNTSIDASTAKIKFGGHLSNANNDIVLELDKERENRQFTISEKERFNGGLTLERIKEERALANIDVTTEMVSDMSDVAAQTSDSNTKRYLEDSYVNTQAVEQTRVFQPLG